MLFEKERRKKNEKLVIFSKLSAISSNSSVYRAWDASEQTAEEIVVSSKVFFLISTKKEEAREKQLNKKAVVGPRARKTTN